MRPTMIKSKINMIRMGWRWRVSTIGVEMAGVNDEVPDQYDQDGATAEEMAGVNDEV